MGSTMTEADVSRAEATRARLFEAAIAAFAEKGFHGTTTRDIASAAGTSPAGLYVHHKSKEELLYLISRSGHENTLALVREAIAGSQDPAQQLRTVFREFAIQHARDHTVARIVNYEIAALSPEHAREIREIRRTVEQEVKEVVRAGAATGRFTTSEPKMAVVALLSLGIDIARWYREGGEWSPEDIGEHYADLSLRIVGAVDVT